VSAIPAPARFAMGLALREGQPVRQCPRCQGGAGLYKLTDADGIDQIDPGNGALEEVRRRR